MSELKLRPPKTEPEFAAHEIPELKPCHNDYPHYDLAKFFGGAFAVAV
jgi:hypothetical protein